MKVGINYVSIFHDPKYAGSIRIDGFKKDKKKNTKFLLSLAKLVFAYKFL